jgi:hypothetical protein
MTDSAGSDNKTFIPFGEIVNLKIQALFGGTVTGDTIR